MRLSAILDTFEPMFYRQLDEWIHITRPTRQVNRNDSSSAWGQHCANAVCGERLTDRIYVREDRFCTSHDNTAGGRDEGTARNDHLIAWFNPQRVKRQFESYCSICDCNCMFAAYKGGKLGFKLFTLLTRPVVQFSRSQDTTRRFDFIFRK